MGTARTNQTSFSLEFPYEGTEQPRRRVWLDRFEIDRDEGQAHLTLPSCPIIWLQTTDRVTPSHLV